jgi:hypothetical protein
MYGNGPFTHVYSRTRRGLGIDGPEQVVYLATSYDACDIVVFFFTILCFVKLFLVLVAYT